MITIDIKLTNEPTEVSKKSLYISNIMLKFSNSTLNRNSTRFHLLDFFSNLRLIETFLIFQNSTVNRTVCLIQIIEQLNLILMSTLNFGKAFLYCRLCQICTKSYQVTHQSNKYHCGQDKQILFIKFSQSMSLYYV